MQSILSAQYKTAQMVVNIALYKPVVDFLISSSFSYHPGNQLLQCI